MGDVEKVVAVGYLECRGVAIFVYKGYLASERRQSSCVAMIGCIRRTLHPVGVGLGDRGGMWETRRIGGGS